MSKSTNIIQCIVPNLTAGEYKVETTQKIVNAKIPKGSEEIRKDLKMGIDAARFTLSGNDIYSVYPPENTNGDYTGHIPHVVFNRRTIPWERTLDGEPPKYIQEGSDDLIKFPPIPWMAVMLFNEDELRTINIDNRPLTELIAPTESDVMGPKITTYNVLKEGYVSLMKWEKTTQQCLTIDVTKDQFVDFVPKLVDLPYLAHSKKVTLTNKDTNGIGDLESKIATKEVNVEQTENTLVVDKDGSEQVKSEAKTKTISVAEKEEGEGYFSVMLGNRLIQDKKSYTAVLVSLEGYQDYIKDSPEVITKEKVRLVVLAHWSYNNSGSRTFKSLLDGLSLQNMGLAHIEGSSDLLKPYLNNGYLPMKHKMRNGAKNISWYRGPFVPNKMGYNSFEFYAYNTSDNALRYDADTGLLDVSIAAAWELGKSLALRNQSFTKAMVEWNTNPLHKPIRNDQQLYSKAEVIDWIEDRYQEKTKESSSSTYKPYPKEVTDFLIALAKLQDVPFSYLMPDPAYIKSKLNDEQGEVLNIFFVNPLWIYALLEGATSLTEGHGTVSKFYVADIIKQVYYYENKPATGFLLYSKIVSGWRGIEIEVYSKSGDKKIDFPVRFECIMPDLFLGIFPDEIGRIVITQPYEGLHFGVKENGDSFEKTPKNKETGAFLDKQRLHINTANNTLKNNDVLNTKVLAAAVQDETKEVEFTSSEYAFQMIDSPIQATFHINYNSND